MTIRSSNQVSKRERPANLQEMNAIKMSHSVTAVAAADGAAVSAAEAMGVKSLLAVLRAATEEECCEILTALHKGMPLYSERMDGAVSATKKVRGRPKKAAVPAAAAAATALPSVEDGDAPTAGAYRLSAAEIDESVCLGRRFNETGASKDKRWKPAVYRETQCGKSVVEGSDLCAVCARRQEKFAAEEDAEKAPKIGWLDRVTEEPPEWCHMLGTAWADEKKPKWLGADATGSEAGSVSGGDEEAPAAAAAAAAAPAPKKAAAAKPSADEKAAALATKKAEKAAAAAAEKAKKEAEKEVAKAAKEAEKAAAKAAKEAAKPAKKETAKPAKKAAAVAAKADTAAAAAEADGELEMIDGVMYMIRSGKAFAYNEVTEETGECVGRLSEDGESILPLAPGGAGAAAEESDDEEEVLAD